jgi:hypothetical protein
MRNIEAATPQGIADEFASKHGACFFAYALTARLFGSTCAYCLKQLKDAPIINGVSGRMLIVAVRQFMRMKYRLAIFDFGDYSAS